MKLLTLNTHSLIEPAYEAKRDAFVEFIRKEQPDVFALQDGVYNAQRHGAEHEHELQRLGHTGEEHSQRGGNEHGFVILALVGIHAAVHGQCNAQQQTGGADHLTNLEAGGSDGSQQVVIGSHVACLFKVDQVVGPSQPQGVLTKHLPAFTPVAMV